MERFRDRQDAGMVLAEHLKEYTGRTDLLVLGLPRGGVPVAAEVARELDAPLDVLLVRKLGVPGHPELAMGAIASGGVRIINQEVVRQLSITENAIAVVASDEERELRRREREYRGDRPDLELSGRTVILVDDGIATGASMRAAVQATRAQDPARVVVAVPVAAAGTCRRMAGEADEVVCARTPEPFRAVGLWYERFDQTTDEEVTAVLEKAAEQARQS